MGNKGAFSFPKLNQEVQVRGAEFMCVLHGLCFCVVCSIGICIWYAFRGIICDCD